MENIHSAYLISDSFVATAAYLQTVQSGLNLEPNLRCGQVGA